MQITDIHNNIIEISDLDQAIHQAALYKEYRHDDPAFSDSDHQRQEYWTDLYRKLLDLKNLQNLTS
ncbi:hypothetical protein PV783_24660 [Chitinophaga sp. CC14]|uniref:hypothetical protein n=1 Tax=Chitinophaga sp. CC14 TaxID=3029199 RepID=UPI003B7C693F